MQPRVRKLLLPHEYLFRWCLMVEWLNVPHSGSWISYKLSPALWQHLRLFLVLDLHTNKGEIKPWILSK